MFYVKIICSAKGMIEKWCYSGIELRLNGTGVMKNCCHFTGQCTSYPIHNLGGFDIAK